MGLLAELALRFAGRPIVVMAGGPSLPAHVQQCPADAVWLSANEHGALLRPADFIVCVDDIEDKLRPLGVPIIGRRHWCDYRIQDWEMIGNSGIQAIWCAWVLGGHPVIVAGMDCYQAGTYWHDEEADSSSLGRPQSFFDERLECLQRHVRGAQIRTCGGPTARFFPTWDASETLPSYTEPAPLQAMRVMEPIRVRTRVGARLGHRSVPEGLTLPVSPAEYRELARRRTAVKIHQETLRATA